MLEKCKNSLFKATQAVTSVALVAMVVLTIAEIVTRQVFNASLLIVDEYCGYLMVVLAYWGAVNAFMDGEFVRVDALFDRLSAKQKEISNFFFTICFAVANGLVTRYAWSNTLKTIRRGDVAATIAQTPLAIPKLCMSIGLTMLEIALFFHIIGFIRERIVKHKESEK